MRIVVRLLGYPRLEIDGRAVDFRLQKGLALIAFLAEARAPATREALSALLWPDLEAEAARARLRRTLHQLRGAVGQDIVAADRNSVRLDPAPDISSIQRRSKQPATGISSPMQCAYTKAISSRGCRSPDARIR